MTIMANGAFGGNYPNERDNSPAGWQRSRLAPDIDWKYHHIISWKTLRDTWQGLLMCQSWKALAFYVKALGIDDVAMVNRLMSGALSYQDQAELFSRLSWPQWNIVEGPADRDDEGGSDVDLFTHGLIGTEPGRMAAIATLYRAMAGFLAHFSERAMEASRESNRNQLVSQYDPQAGRPAQVGPAIDLLTAALRGMFPYSAETFISYREAMWKTTLAGRVHQKFAQVWLRTPRFKKSDGAPYTPPVHFVRQENLVCCPGCSHKFNPDTALSGGASGLKRCPKCGKNVYAKSHAFKDPQFT